MAASQRIPLVRVRRLLDQGEANLGAYGDASGGRSASGHAGNVRQSPETNGQGGRSSSRFW